MWHDLVSHKGFADAALLTAVAGHAGARTDGNLRAVLHHILVSSRFWLLAIVDEPFAAEIETRVPEALDAVVAGFQATHTRELQWLAGATEQDFGRVLARPFILGGTCTVAEALLQVCLHSQGHRAQAATQLRALGGEPPATDFIVWRIDRPAPVWPAVAP